MKKHKCHFLFIIVTLPLLSFYSLSYGASQSSGGQIIDRYIMAGAGVDSSSKNNTLSHMPGQSSPITSSSSSGYSLYGGFRKSSKAVSNEPDGDVAPLGNRDGTVNVGDALMALRFALGLETPTQEDMGHGDVAPLDAGGQPEPDGEITVGDALVILRKALGIISFFVNSSTEPSYQAAVFYYPW